MINAKSQSALTATRREKLLKVAFTVLLLSAVLCDMFVQSVRLGFPGIYVDAYIIGFVRLPQSSYWEYPPPLFYDPLEYALTQIVFLTGTSFLALLLMMLLWRWLEKKFLYAQPLPSHRLGLSPHRWFPGGTRTAEARKMKRAWHYQRRLAAGRAVNEL